MKADAYTDALLERIDTLTYLLKRQQNRTREARKSRNMWRDRARSAERAGNGSQYLRAKVKKLERELQQQKYGWIDRMNQRRREAA